MAEMIYHVVRLTRSVRQRARYGIAQQIDRWGSGALELELVHGEQQFYSSHSAHERARQMMAAVREVQAKRKATERR